ncbi:MAG TPA: porin [Bdellovibrionales bacterium]|nr:porin [Bdellovibrionales bacterium]
MTLRFWPLLVSFILLLPLRSAIGSETTSETRSAAEADEGVAANAGPKWNEYDGQYFTARGGFGLLLDTAAYDQDSASAQQMHLNSSAVLRDFRFLLKGKFKFAPRLSYTLGYMYDGANEVWRFRQTGLMIDVPELNGNFFIGRTKEGFSTNKIMVGYNGWTIERSAANDAFLPILADGIKFTGGAFNGKLVYNVGWFTNAIARVAQTYVKNDNQTVARAVWLPFAKSDHRNVLHLAIQGRYANAKEGTQQYRSKPESFPAQSFAIDTGEFAAENSRMLGVEAYFRPGSWVFGSEYYWNQVSSAAKSDPFFQGGDVFAAYLLTGEIRPYNEKGAYFEMVKPERSVFSGGSGAFELVLRYSYADLDSGSIEGGRFQRITPMVNWHLSDNVRLELAYGYSILNRFDIEGRTQYFQSRLQFQL